MSTALALLTLAGTALVLVLAYRLNTDIQLIRRELKQLKQSARVVIPVARHHRWAAIGKGYYALWRWDGKAWSLVLGVIPPGANAGLPPKERGQCIGETRKVWVPSVTT